MARLGGQGRIVATWPLGRGLQWEPTFLLRPHNRQLAAPKDCWDGQDFPRSADGGWVLLLVGGRLGNGEHGSGRGSCAARLGW